ncbi:class I adenylate-forming enzyme family protein [Nonomuraea roseola]|uniref:Class I adenylate-forming enzyme family protein n=1 Tax=Nonomuraea roseola TaxID=46179 RepID=A0ABV5QBK2_9ACTN
MSTVVDHPRGSSGPTTVPDLLRSRAALEPDRVALAVAGHGELTMREWHLRADSAARGLLARGLRRGERVGLLFAAKDWIAFAIAYCAVQRAGAVAVPLSDRLAPAELAYLLDDCAAVGVLHGEGALPPPGAYWSCQAADLEAGPENLPRPPDVESGHRTAGERARGHLPQDGGHGVVADQGQHHQIADGPAHLPWASDAQPELVTSTPKGGLAPLPRIPGDNLVTSTPEGGAGLADGLQGGAGPVGGLQGGAELVHGVEGGDAGGRGSGVGVARGWASQGGVGVEVNPGDLAQILYTSGTTGRPKAVGASHANLTHDRALRPNRRRFAHSTRLLHAFPIGTNAAQAMLMNALDAHPTVMTLPTFTAARFARLIESHAVGTVFVVPSMASELLNHGAHERHDLSSVVLLGSAAAALPPALSLRLSAAFPNATLVNYYTSTEAAPAQTVMVFDKDRPAALGRAGFGSALRVTGEDGRRLPPGEVGEIWLRSAAAPRSYIGSRTAGENADGRTADTGRADGEAGDLVVADGAVTGRTAGGDVRLAEVGGGVSGEGSGGGVFRDGWVRMGDLGYLDRDGYLYLVDRESDVVKSGAFKVSTLQVEAALYEHPGVAEAAVVGVEHPVLGTALAAAVVPRGPDLSVTALRAFLADRLARHEIPHRVLVVADLPRNRSGKVVKEELRAMIGKA